MTRRSKAAPSGDALWAHHHGELRDPQDVVVQWQPHAAFDPGLLAHEVTGPFWDLLDETGVTLVVTREYEHLVVALAGSGARARLSYLRLPHPNGLAMDQATGVLHIASTRNPNMVFDFREVETGSRKATSLMPLLARYYPGRVYMHDLAVIGRKLFVNAVGHNAIAELPVAGGHRLVWWPRSIEGSGARGPRFDRNYLQLNAIAAGRTLAGSYFAASAAKPMRVRPGQLEFPVDKRGVVFSGRTREVFAGGLTRPHSLRFRGRELWVDNSGYGELGRVTPGRYEPVLRLPGWTRGLAFAGRYAFVGTSRVIPKFRAYAPGLAVEKSRCGVHVVDLEAGRIVASLEWALGNQIFAIETLPSRCIGFPFAQGEEPARVQETFYGHAAAPGLSRTRRSGLGPSV